MFRLFGVSLGHSLLVLEAGGPGQRQDIGTLAHRIVLLRSIEKDTAKLVCVIPVNSNRLEMNCSSLGTGERTWKSG